MNHVNLIGKVTSLPRFYETKSGRKIAQFTLATKETYLNDQGEEKKRSHWHRISAWGKWAKILEEFSQIGSEMAVEGKLITRFFERDGERQFISEVEVNDLVLM